MGFSSLFELSFREFKLNITLFFKISFFFLFIPLLVSLLISTIFNILLVSLILYFLTLIGLFLSIVFFIHLSILRKTGFSTNFNELCKGLKGSFFRYFLLFIFVFIFLILFGALFFFIGFFVYTNYFNSIFILPVFFLAPIFTFFLYFIFSPFIMNAEHTGIFDSIKRSFLLVKGKWLYSFWNLILLLLIAIFVVLLFSIPYILVSIFLIILSDLTTFGLKTKIILLVARLISSLSLFFVVPMAVLFLKNFYYNLKSLKGNVFDGSSLISN